MYSEFFIQIEIVNIFDLQSRRHGYDITDIMPKPLNMIRFLKSLKIR